MDHHYLYQRFNEPFYCWCLDRHGIGTDTARLRALRDGRGTGRVYEITFVANDQRGGLSTGVVRVYVPHDFRSIIRDELPSDDGQIYSATDKESCLDYHNKWRNKSKKCKMAKHKSRKKFKHKRH